MKEVDESFRIQGVVRQGHVISWLFCFFVDGVDRNIKVNVGKTMCGCRISIVRCVGGGAHVCSDTS